jgi:phosphatidate phosphatase PAH1
MVAFARCGVPEARIFIVSPDTGEISGMNRTYRSSYEQVNQVLHEMFPAVSGLHTLHCICFVLCSVVSP